MHGGEELPNGNGAVAVAIEVGTLGQGQRTQGDLDPGDQLIHGDAAVLVEVPDARFQLRSRGVGA